MTRREIAFYLSPDGVDSFWFWSEGLESVTWWSGDTIAFYQEIDLGLRALERFGLPLFSEIVLVLAACRANWNEPAGGKVRLAEYLQSLDRNPFGRGEERRIRDWVSQLFAGLDAIHAHAVAAEEPGRKETLLEILFERHGNVLDPGQAEAVAAAVLRGKTNLQDAVETGFAQVGRTLDSRTPRLSLVRTIRHLLDIFPVLEEIESLSIREKTGLDRPVEAAPELLETLPDAERVRALITGLQRKEESELSGLAEIARDLLGVLQVPRELSEPEEQPMGGYSDISNRGELDRLLLTELAQDDEMLAIRVALNEALYLRRESPPRRPPRRRRILIDNGIRMWGVPRACAHAAALALGAGAGRRDAVEYWSTDFISESTPSSVLRTADLRTERGLVESLSRLDPSPHPGDKLDKFFRGDGGAGEMVESIVITHPAVCGDTDFRGRLGELSAVRPIFLVTIDGSGWLRFAVRSPAGERHLQRVKLDVDRILRAGDARSAGAGEVRVPLDPELPKIFGYRRFPLLLAHPLVDRRSWASERGDVVTLTRKGLLYHYTDRMRGAKLLSDSLVVRGQCLCGEFGDDGDLVLCFGRSTQPRTVSVELESGEVRVQRHELSWPALGATVRAGSVVFFSAQEAVAFDRYSGEEQMRVALPVKPRKVCGRFVQLGSTWHAVGLGATITLTPIELPNYAAIFLVFDCPLHAAPLVLRFDGKVQVFDGERNPELEFAPRSSGYISDALVLDRGHRLMVTESATRHSHTIYDFENETVRQTTGAARHRLLSAQESRIPSLRKRIRGLKVTADSGRLELLTRRDAIGIPLLVRGGDLLLRQNEASREGREFDFEPVGSAAPGYELSRIDFPDGSTAFLDSRGMLHLKSGDPEVPEMSIVLKDDGQLSGWISTGETFGHPYFIGDGPTVTAKALDSVFRRFLAPVVASCSS